MFLIYFQSSAFPKLKMFMPVNVAIDEKATMGLKVFD
jgi:hypothetical protein